jgi:RND family efflux transporter MFP subunit
VKAKQSSATEIEGAKLTVDRDQKNFNRGKELFEGKLISQEAFDNLYADLALAQNALTKAQAAMEEIDEQLKRTNVTSPTDGTVLVVPVAEGQVMIAAASVNSGTTMMTIANLSKLLVQVHINQVDVARLQINKMVKLRAESLHDLDMNAKITFIAPVATVTNNVKGFDVQATIEKPNPRLRCGMTVNMTVPIARAESAISVPISALFKGEGNSKVVYVRSGEQTEKRPVKIGVTNIDYAEILKGVNEGEEILLVEPEAGGQKKS